MPTTTAPTTRVSSGPLLDAVSTVVADQARVEVAKLLAVLDWAAAHPETDPVCLADTSKHVA